MFSCKLKDIFHNSFSEYLRVAFLVFAIITDCQQPIVILYISLLMFVLFLPQKVAAFYLRVAQDSECYRKISLNVLFAESKRQEIKQAYISKYNSKNNSDNYCINCLDGLLSWKNARYLIKY